MNVEDEGTWFPKIGATFFGVPYYCSILGSMLGPLVLANYHFGRVMPLGTAARVELSQGSIQVSAALGQDLGCESYSYYYVL